ncbi:MAG: thiamine phosphate synthase [Proteobacteria bacterium]|nr:thiamine phosphate synthase [Pseudomonadota bacterium]
MADANHDPRSIRRLEDSRFLTGRGRYVEDIAEPAALHGHVLRSPHAHAVIRSLDTSPAASMPGVRLIATADDLAADGLGFMPCLAAVTPMIVPPRPALASGRVRHVGDPVCFVVADSAEMAREAAERISIDYEPLPSVIHGRTALAAGAPALWDEAPGNLVYHVQRGDPAAVAEAMKKAARIVEVDVTNNRVIVVPLEPRAGIARYDATTDTMDLELTGQGLHGIRRQLAEFIFKVAPERIQLHAPDVGGGFGMKNFLYPEWILLLWAARRLQRPVRWLADRAEDFVMGAQGRDIEATARIALDATGRLLALDVAMVANLGAYLSGNGPGASVVAASTAQGGVYDIPAIAVDVRGAVTNTTPVDAYRGAGKPEANYIVERAIEAAARVLGRDPADLRRQNLIASFPHRTAMGMAIDSGDFVANLEAAVARTPGFEERRAVAKARGRLRGLGVACFLETSRGAPNEGAEVRFEPDGSVMIAVGTESNGQGHETSFAQIAATHLGLPIEAFRYVQADTRAVRSGAGHGGARSMHMGGAALVRAMDAALAKARRLAAHLLQASEQEIGYGGGRFTVRGTDRSIDLATLAAEAAANGATLLQLRDKHAGTRLFIERTRAVKAALAGRIPLLVNDRVDIALAAGADGVHLGNEDMLPADARRLLGPEAIIGITLKSSADIAAAPLTRIDYGCIGGVFSTSSKDNPDPPVGLAGLARLRAEAAGLKVPIGAIAGIDATNLADVIAAGADGVAIISALFMATDVGAATRDLRARVDRALATSGRQP